MAKNMFTCIKCNIAERNSTYYMSVPNYFKQQSKWWSAEVLQSYMVVFDYFKPAINFLKQSGGI